MTTLKSVFHRTEPHDMPSIRTLNEREDIVKDFLRHFQEYKIFKQKAFYFGDGVDHYYDMSAKKMDEYKKSEERFYSFIRHHCLDTDQRVALVSLGCGNAQIEHLLMKRMKEDGYDFTFFGVDSSADMIDLAKKTLKKAGLKGELLCADFSSEAFFQTCRKELADFDKRIFTFLGGTLGNVEQSYIADILSDMLQPDDVLWIDVSRREEKTEKNDITLFEYYLAWLENDDNRQFLTKPLHDVGIPLENGELFLQMMNEDDIQALRFVFRFRIQKKTVTSFEGKTVTLLPGNVVDLLTVRTYDPDGLVHFFEERDFNFVAKESQGRRAQFLFQKR